MSNKTLIIIPAAGKGSRFQELGKNYPKCILPIDNKPIIVHNIELFLDKFGDDCEIRVVTSTEGYEIVHNLLQMYFSKEMDGRQVKVIQYEAQLCAYPGPVASISAGFPVISTFRDVLICLSDIVVTYNLYTHEAIKQIKNRQIPVGFVDTINVDTTSRWCIVWNEDGVLKFKDKPVDFHHNNALTGVYYFSSFEKFKTSLQGAVLEISEILEQYQIEMGGALQIRRLYVSDFGTLKEYLSSRKVSISRSFNTVERLSSNIIAKSSQQNPEKIVQEVEWYKRLPSDISVYTPKIFDYTPYSGSARYAMEFVRSPTARELMLFLDGSTETWEGFFDVAFSVLKQMENYQKPGRNNFMDSVVEKTKHRLSNIHLCIDNNSRYDKAYNFIEDLEQVVIEIDKQDSLFHGDFCFSNIIYNPIDGSFKMIDPRGEPYGNIYYDLAKLMHSVCYPYDYIDAELYSFNDDEVYFYDANRKTVEAVFIRHLKKFIGEDKVWIVRYITASLFLSMIPLHSHNAKNQELFYAVFEKVYADARAERKAAGC